MSNEPQKLYQLFEDLVEKQQEVKAKAGKTTLEEARNIVKWLKSKDTDKKMRPEKLTTIIPILLK